ncbi:porin family protein [Draconibacterium sp. IB214405]|uniref:porin family protein n=1 Tax=Draconibacterium sp. IB214405 TaxID=3097352 RepID=UPI002A0FF626|nr:porin family protein [Draconibacterium sp. IB214405]MDX8337911.1 porin family protein [Draconibacterium sp. IB214405]
MKKLLIISIFLLLSTFSEAQVLISLLLGDKLNSPNIEFGLEGGLNFSNINGFDNAGNLRSLNLGLYFDIRMKNNWFLHTGFQGMSSLGMRDLSSSDLEFLEADIYDVEGKYNQKVLAFMVPILANYKFDNHFYVEAGPQLGWLYDGWIAFTSDAEEKDWKIKDFNKEQFNWFNAGIAVGAGYKLLKGTGWSLGVRYYQGLTDVYKNRSKSLHHSLLLKVSVPIGVAKKPD